VPAAGRRSCTSPTRSSTSTSSSRWPLPCSSVTQVSTST
jgi:hypothetical protein